jgi:hypothetical protein
LIDKAFGGPKFLVGRNDLGGSKRKKIQSPQISKKWHQVKELIKWSSLGMGFLLETPLMSHHTILNHTYHFPSLFPSISLSLGILGCIDPRRGCPSFYGKKGLKAQRG